MSNPIPTAAREAVKARDFGRCVRCGAFGATDIHHRKRRREGGHPLSNLILVDRGCHSWIHANPTKAKEQGLIVSVWESPVDAPMKSWRGWTLLDDEGRVAFIASPEEAPSNKKEEA